MERGVGEENDFTPYEIIEGLDAEDKKYLVDKSIDEATWKKNKDEWYDRLKFKQFTELDYSGNHVGKAYQVFHSMMGAEEVNIDQIVKHEPFRGLVFDRGKFEEQVKEKFIKPIRYAFSTYANIDYSKTMRVQKNAGDVKEGQKPEYEEKTFAEAMFGPSVLEDFYKKENGATVINKKELQSKEGRIKLYKNVCRSILASQLKSHRERMSGYSHMNYEQIEKFIEALESIKAVEIAADGETLSVKDSFFTHKDIAWIRKNSGTEKWRMLLTEVTPGVGLGVLGGIGKSFQDLSNFIFK